MNQTIPRQWPDSASLRSAVREISPDVLLSFSGGKDALACWYALRESGFRRVVPFYLELVPGLEFVEQSLRRYEAELATPIVRVPHPSLIRMLRNLVWQPPERCAAIEALGLRPVSYEQTEDHVRELVGLPDAWVANGARMADSQARMAGMKRHGAANPARKHFFAVFDWRIADLEACFERNHAWLPVDYEMFGRSFDGLHAEYLFPIRERFPRDYERILQWFPLARLEYLRHGVAEP